MSQKIKNSFIGFLSILFVFGLFFIFLAYQTEKSQAQESGLTYDKSYSLDNIKKLRKARVFPVGLEIAARLIAVNNNPSNPKPDPKISEVSTLENLMSKFNDSNSPFYHLVDPTWIIKLPQTRCQQYAYSSILQSTESNMRQEICVDEQSCLAENDSGQCLDAWGYCAREKNVWRFSGDSCPSYYDSCQTFKPLGDTTATTVSYNRNSLDGTNICNAGNAGCKWYSKNFSNGNWQNQTNSDKIYFNRNAQTCSANDEGCSEFISLRSGSNYINDSNFELADMPSGNGDFLKPANWFGPAAVQRPADSYLGQSRLKITAGTARYKFAFSGTDAGKVFLQAGETYTASIFIKTDNNFADTDSPVTLTVRKYLAGAANAEDSSSKTILPTTNWQRIETTLLTAGDGDELDMYIAVPAGKTVFVDAVQLERGNKAGAYQDYGRSNLVYLKQAPAYLSCRGYTLSHLPPALTSYSDAASCQNGGGFWQINKCFKYPFDNANCAKYALKCEAEEIGCDKFTPTNSDPAIPGIAKGTDFCPAECVGYSAYKQKETNFEPSPTTLLNFIPATAQICSASESGCDQFTNIDALARGGEGIEYFTYLRQCEKPTTDNTGVYYTWEGSDTLGYQLKVFNLIKDTDTTAIAVRGEKGNPAKYVPEFTNYSLCNANIFRAASEPDCKQFYDQSGNITYRLYSKTITSSDDCHPYRKTSSATLTAATQSDCDKLNGDWDGSKCAKTNFLAIPNEAISCSAAALGCREYRGNTGNNTRNVINDDFEKGTSAEWVGGTQTNISVSLSNESTSLIGHSLLINTSDPTKVISKTVVITPGRTYNLTFWAKTIGAGQNALTIKFKNASADEDIFSVGAVKINQNWNFYSLGPVFIAPTRDTAGETLQFSGFTANAYLDNILLQEVTDNLFLIKDSWQTPASCDKTIYGATSPQEMLGCRAYTDRAGNARYLKSFSRICREEAVGCEAMIDTKNSSETPYAKTYNTPANGDAVSVGADQLVTMVNDSSKYCASANKGCQALGQPKISAGQVTGFDNAYLLNNPDNYKDVPKAILCQASELNCAEYGYGKGSTFFKSPGANLCEYRLNVNLGAETRSGWFKKGTSEGCNALSSKQSDCAGNIWDPSLNQCAAEIKLGTNETSCSDNNGIWRQGKCLEDPFRLLQNTDTNFVGRTGECAEKYSSCSEFIDSDPSYVENGAFEISRYDACADDACRNSLQTATVDDPAAWLVGAGLVKLDSQAHSGRFSSRIVKAADSSDNSFLTQTVNDLKANKTYIATAWFKAKAGVYGSLKFGLGTDKKQGNDRWQKLEVRYTVPSSVTFQASGTITVFGPRNNGVNHIYVSSDPTGEAGLTDFVLYDDVEIKEERNTEYFYLSNEHLDKTTCTTENPATGCVRFLDTNPDVNNYELIKVRPDRTCGEWLHDCVANPGGICQAATATTPGDGVILCEEFEPGNPSICKRKVDPALVVDLSGDLNSLAGLKAIAARYSQRSIGWRYGDYTGWSIPGFNPWDEFDTSKKLSTLSNTSPSAVLCRAYPEKDSPFPSSVKAAGIVGFARANVCNTSEDCECSYKKAEVGAEPVYYGKEKSLADVPNKLCTSGNTAMNTVPCDKDWRCANVDSLSFVDKTDKVTACTPTFGTCSPDSNKKCLTDADCGGILTCAGADKKNCISDPTVPGDGICSSVSKVTSTEGIKGWCMEYDKSLAINGTTLGVNYGLNKESNPCLTWFPFKSCVEGDKGKLCMKDEDCGSAADRKCQ